MTSKDISLMIGEVKFNFRVGVVIEYNGKVLIERNPRIDYGVIPGGRVKTLEDVKSALVRELREEMHVNFLKRELILQNFIENFYMFNGTKTHEIYVVYRVRLRKNSPLLKREKLINYDSKANYYEFVNIKDIDKYKIKPYVLKKYIKSSKFKTTIVRDIYSKKSKNEEEKKEEE